jgi:L-ascorbate peroxidase
MNPFLRNFLAGCVIAVGFRYWSQTDHFRALSNTQISASPQGTSKESLLGAQTMIDELIKEKNCGPILVRLAWHDSGTYDKSITSPWPAAGGAIGSIRFAPEINHGANNGLINAVKLLEPIKEKYPDVSWADIIQMASARSIELAGGPTIDMIYGRVEATGPEMCSKEGNLPDGNPGSNNMYGGKSGTQPTEDSTPEGHLRKVFYKMGFDDQEIVALSGAHTFGRAYKDRSGEGAEKTKFTDGSKQVLKDGSEAKYTPGGSSWTPNFLVFDNSYFQITERAANGTPDDSELLSLSTDKVIFKDEKFKPFAEKYRDSQDAFFADYAKAHKKLSELGSKFEPAGGIKL